MAADRRGYPFDAQVRELVADRLYALLPALYRVEADRDDDKTRRELWQLLHQLAAPLAAVRQNVEELHADLFIDSCGNPAIALLADMVGTRLVFPDADSNRRDVRGTVAWRRRKGTPSMLQEMAEELADSLVVVMEGWQRVLIAQHIDLPRPERLCADIRDPRLAEASTGPLDTGFHAVDVRAIGRTTGRHHPRHVCHWLHATELFPVSGGTATYVGDHGDPTQSPATPGADPDWRFAIHPLGRYQALRARRVSADDALRTDRIPPMHFAAEPEAWFGAEGRFAVRIAGLLAGVAGTSEVSRRPHGAVASGAILDAPPALTLLDHTVARFVTPVELALCAVELAGGVPDTANPAAVDVRVTLSVDASGTLGVSSPGTGAASTGAVAMLRLRATAGAGTFFPGATLAVAGGGEAGTRAHADPALALEGYLAGALAVSIPATWVIGERWFAVAADGSLYDAQSGGGAADIAIGAALPANRLVSTGPGPAWPPRPATQSTERSTEFPPAPGRGPVVLHGARALLTVGGAAPPDAELALAFAAGYVDGGVVRYRPLVRLAWTGPDPAAATWRVLADDGTEVADPDARLHELELWRRVSQLPLARLAVRAEADRALLLAPGEVAWSGRAGDALLVHLPELATTPGVGVDWPAPAPYTAASPAVAAAADGATWWETGGPARRAQGAIAPIREHVLHRRRRIRWRSLCQWSREAAAGTEHAATPPGFLDIDVGHGLFALALDEPAQLVPLDARGAPRAPNLSVEFQDGYTGLVGARPAPREPALNERLPAPTRIVTRHGVRAERAAAPGEPALPRHRSLAEALAAAELAEEVIQVEDSATYPGESVVWPAGVDRLVIQAAEVHRPVLELVASAITPGATFAEIILHGLALGGGAELALPPSARAVVRYCSVTSPDVALRFAAPAEGARIEVSRSVTAALSLAGAGTLRIADSVVDAGATLQPTPVALTAADADLEIERTTVFGTVSAHLLHAGNTIFVDSTEVEDRFHGCVRFSRATGDSVLPRRHQVVVDMPPRFVSLDRHDPTHARLAENCHPAILYGADDGAEMGAFQSLQASRRREALLRRLREFTPAGLVTGLVRVD